MKKNSSVLKKLIAYLKPEIPQIIISLILAAAVVTGTLYLPVLLGQAVDNIIGEGNVLFDGLIETVIKMVVIIAAVAVLQWIMSMINNQIAYKTAWRLRSDFFDHLHETPLSWLDAHSDGDNLSRAVNDVELISDGLLLGFSQLFTGVLTIICTLVFMFRISVIITLIVIALTPMSFLIARFVAKNSHSMFMKQADTRGRLTGFTDESITNLKTLIALGRQEEAREKFAEMNGELTGYSQKAQFFSSLVNPSTRFIYAMIYAGVAIAGGFSVLNAAMTVGRLTTFLGYINQYSKPFNEITGIVAEFQNALAGAQRVFEFMETESVRDAENAGDMENVSGDVDIINVDFAYEKGRNVLSDINLNVKRGMRAAIVGPTGCGKTTLINLLMRFYDADSGEILIDGNNIKDHTRSSLRRNFAMVLQNTWLKTDTVKENIRYGKPDATDEEVIAAAKEAQAHGFIMRLPEGYDTVLGDGLNISEGERQLLCIARVMLTKPPMLLLDEATSSIDSMTEIRITRDFARLMEGRTSFVVAHRLSTIVEADMIIAMKDGRIIETGTHEELLAKGGFYSDLYNSQWPVEE